MRRPIRCQKVNGIRSVVYELSRGFRSLLAELKNRSCAAAPSGSRTGYCAPGDVVTLFMGDRSVSHTQNRTVDEVKNERRHRRLRPERQRE